MGSHVTLTPVDYPAAMERHLHTVAALRGLTADALRSCPYAQSGHLPIGHLAFSHTKSTDSHGVGAFYSSPFTVFFIIFIYFISIFCIINIYSALAEQRKHG